VGRWESKREFGGVISKKKTTVGKRRRTEKGKTPGEERITGFRSEDHRKDTAGQGARSQTTETGKTNELQQRIRRNPKPEKIRPGPIVGHKGEVDCGLRPQRRGRNG